MTKNIYTKMIENEELLEKEMGLHYPPNLTLEEKGLWNEFYYYLKKGYESFILNKEQVPQFQKKMFNMPSIEAKNDYLFEISQKFNEKLENVQDTINIIKKINTGKIVDEEKLKLPKSVQPLFEYLFYTVAMGQEIDPEIRDLLEQDITPEDWINAGDVDVRAQIENIRLNPLNVRSFGKAFDKNQISAFLDSELQSQTDTPKNNTPIKTEKPTVVETQSNYNQDGDQQNFLKNSQPSQPITNNGKIIVGRPNKGLSELLK